LREKLTRLPTGKGILTHCIAISQQLFPVFLEISGFSGNIPVYASYFSFFHEIFREIPY